jgi:hypothetical protein
MARSRRRIRQNSGGRLTFTWSRTRIRLPEVRGKAPVLVRIVRLGPDLGRHLRNGRVVLRARSCWRRAGSASNPSPPSGSSAAISSRSRDRAGRGAGHLGRALKVAAQPVEVVGEAARRAFGPLVAAGGSGPVVIGGASRSARRRSPRCPWSRCPLEGDDGVGPRRVEAGEAAGHDAVVAVVPGDEEAHDEGHGAQGAVGPGGVVPRSRRSWPQ